MSVQRVAVIGDVHGCSDEFAKLINRLEWLSLDEIWTVGDLIDRGPDSAGVIDLCINKGIKSVCGNHEQSILGHKKRWVEQRVLPKNKDKAQTIQQLDVHHFNYIESLPFLHVIDDLGLIIVHAGLFPKLPLYAQPINVCRAQLIHPDHPGQSKWWGEKAPTWTGKTEQELYKEGWLRWYRVYDYKEDVIFGHSTFAQPMIHQSLSGGKCIGIDTGSSFGGSLTACIYDINKDPFFLSIKNKKVYYKDTTRSFWEG